MVKDYRRGEFWITTERQRMDLEVIHGFISRSYWATGRSVEKVRKTIANSLCFGLFEGKAQIGFARVITDYAIFAYLADVFVLETHRGRGLGKWLMECITGHPELQEVKKWMLATSDAHGLYRQYGFQALADPSKYMERLNPRYQENSRV